MRIGHRDRSRLLLAGLPGLLVLPLACRLSGLAEPPVAPAPTVEATAPPPTPVDGAATGAPGLGDPLYPFLGNGGYDALHYTIQLIVNVENNALAGTTTMEARALQDLTAFNLDFSGLEISQVLVNETPAEFTRDGSELAMPIIDWLEPSKSVPPG